MPQPTLENASHLALNTGFIHEYAPDNHHRPQKSRKRPAHPKNSRQWTDEIVPHKSISPTGMTPMGLGSRFTTRKDRYEYFEVNRF